MASEKSMQCEEENALRTAKNSCLNDDIASNKDKTSYQCRLCPAQLSSRYRYDCHWTEYHDDTSRMLMYESPVLCGRCGEMFSNSRSLSCHKNSKGKCAKVCVSKYRKKVNKVNRVRTEQLPPVASEESHVHKTARVQSVICNTEEFDVIYLPIVGHATGQIGDADRISMDLHFNQQFSAGNCFPNTENVYDSTEYISMSKNDFAIGDRANSLDTFEICSHEANNSHEDGIEHVNNELANWRKSLLAGEIKTTDEISSTVDCVRWNSPDVMEIQSPASINSNLLTAEIVDQSSPDLPLDGYRNIEKCNKTGGKIKKKGRTMYTCRICSKIFTYVAKYKSHFSSAHSNLPIDDMFDDGWKCSLCVSVHINIYGLRNHWRTMHTEMFNKKQFNEFVKSQSLQ